MLEEKIINLKKNIVEYSGLIENMIETSIKGIETENKDILNEIIKNMEPKANHFEIAIDEMCINIIAQYAPKGKDLRIILMILEMNKELERVGDHCVNIAQSSIYLIDRPLPKNIPDLSEMSKIAREMFKKSINAFINESQEDAKNVCEKDYLVDNLGEKILKESVAIMTEDSSSIERALHLIRISHNLERIADISTNLCEEVIYLTSGRVIKHHKENISSKK